MRTGPTTGSPRGCLVGGMVAALAVAAHGAAGGGYPDSTELALLLLISTLTGWLATSGTARDGARAATLGRARATIFAQLALGQLGGHAVLSGLIDHSHAHPPQHLTAGYLPTGWMLVAHLIATVGCVVLIRLAERLYAVASSVVHAVSATVSVPRITEPIRWSNPGLRHYSFHPNGAIGPRAPPVSA